MRSTRTTLASLVAAVAITSGRLPALPHGYSARIKHRPPRDTEQQREIADWNEAVELAKRAVAAERERWIKGHDRYEVARLMNPGQWAEACRLNVTTGKPFDQIIDELAPFYGKTVRAA